MPAEVQHVNEELFEKDAEKALYAAVRKAAGKVSEDKRAGKYQEALEEIAGLRKVVDQFFVEVMVMAEDEAVRKNRLALLAELLREFTTIADFSELGGRRRAGFSPHGVTQSSGVKPLLQERQCRRADIASVTVAGEQEPVARPLSRGRSSA